MAGLAEMLKWCSSLREQQHIAPPLQQSCGRIQNHKDKSLLQYTDPKVAAAGIQIRSGRKWSAKRELQVAEERLRHKDILGSIAKGRAGLGFFPSTHTISTKGKERCHLILEEVREGVMVKWSVWVSKETGQGGRM